MLGENGPASCAFRVVAVAAQEPDRLLTTSVDGMRELRDDQQDLDQLGPHRHRRIGGETEQERQGCGHGRAQPEDTFHQNVAEHPLGLGSRQAAVGSSRPPMRAPIPAGRRLSPWVRAAAIRVGGAAWCA